MTLFVISYTIVLLVSTLCIHNVVALEISLAKQLTAIEKLVDKNEAIAQLNQLKKSQLLSSKNHTCIREMYVPDLQTFIKLITYKNI